MRRAILLAITILCGCSGPRPIALEFRGVVGAEQARCGQSYASIGTSSSMLRIADFRLYVSGIRVVTDTGEQELTLDQDGTWQQRDVAMLDFEDATGDCTMGTTLTNDTVHGTLAMPGEIRGIRFRVGVPFDLDHANAATAAAPLNYTSLFWGWNAGYKFLRFDGISTGMPRGFAMHLGSTGCVGDGRGNVTSCTQDNLAEVELTPFDPDTDRIDVDVAALLAGDDIDADRGGETGCTSGFDDPDCEPFFNALGLGFAGRPAPGPQTAFRRAE